MATLALPSAVRISAFLSDMLQFPAKSLDRLTSHLRSKCQRPSRSSVLQSRHMTAATSTRSAYISVESANIQTNLHAGRICSNDQIFRQLCAPDPCPQPSSCNRTPDANVPIQQESNQLPVSSNLTYVEGHQPMITHRATTRRFSRNLVSNTGRQCDSRRFACTLRTCASRALYVEGHQPINTQRTRMCRLSRNLVSNIGVQCASERF